MFLGVGHGFQRYYIATGGWTLHKLWIEYTLCTEEREHRSALDLTLTIDPHRLNTMSIAVRFAHVERTHRHR